jgi:D-proline reductase (dithiol) PrdB
VRPPVDYIERTREQYASLGHPPYKWVENPDPPPFVPLRKRLQDARIGLIASGGIYAQGQVAFNFRDDTSFRIIPRETTRENLRATHFAYDLTDARQDPHVVFPLETLRKLQQDGRIGEVAKNAYTFMGGIYSSRKVKQILAPALADRAEQDEVDAVVLVPV